MYGRLRSLRKALGFHSIQEFAAELDIPFQTLTNYEQAKTPKIPHTFLLLLATKCQVSIDWLLLGQGAMKRENQITNLTETEIDLIQSYRMLAKKRQEAHYFRIKADAAEAEATG
ncbi:hypothetical protein FACS1894103_3930 [Campylobacterota bacterium]|nr:hypothetical protein FACS1894103_3930 [Campylobacterota bacterium]